MKKFRYLIIGPKYMNQEKRQGGTPILVEELLEFMKKEQKEYEFISTLQFGEKKSTLNFLFTLVMFFIKMPKSDIVIVNVSRNGAYYFSPIALFFTKLFKKRFVFRRFGGNCLELYQNAKGLRKRLIEYVFNNADIMFFEPKFIVDFFLQKRANVYSLPNARKASLIKRDPTLPYSKKFIFLGHIKKEKGIDELLEASKLLDRSYTIELYGSLEYGNYTKEDFEQYPNVSYKGVVEYQEVYSILSQHDVLILPSYKEGYPGVIIEAFAVGLPVIATNLTSIQEMTDSSCALLINPKSATELAEAMQYFNKENYQKYSTNASKKFLEYETNRVHAKMLALCQKDLK